MIIRLAGDLVEERPALPRIVTDALTHGRDRFLIDLTDVTNIDIANAGDLAASRWTAQGAGAEVKLLNASEEHIELIWLAYRESRENIEKTGVRRTPVEHVDSGIVFEFENFSNETEAVASFDCPTWDALRAWAKKGLAADEAPGIAVHLPDCPWCRQRLQLIDAAEAAEPPK